jgi:anthranilate phosphoribosyltransferase
MGISHYIKEIGRGRDGARALTRADAAELMGQILDGKVTDLELGAFCIAMRVKGETPEEMAGFLDATQTRLNTITVPDHTPAVSLPCYNGARKLPVLTPLLGHLLAREGVAVVMHGTATESTRVTSQDVLCAMGVAPLTQTRAVHAGDIVFVPTDVLCSGLKKLLDVRRVIGLRNPAHSLVKLINPTAGDALLVSSYTHPEYAVSMAATFELTGARAVLLRGTEGEVVADPRRTPRMDAFAHGQRILLAEAQTGSLQQLPNLPQEIDPTSTARYIQAVLDGHLPTPAPLTQQVHAILRALAL